MAKQILFYLLVVLLFCSCKSKPSDADIKRKILLDYTCPETVQVSFMQINNTEVATSFIGLKGYEYTVSGEVEWKEGCNDFGTNLPRGYKEKFANKKVILIKGEEGWR
jgi:hypothetical protein